MANEKIVASARQVQIFGPEARLVFAYPDIRIYPLILWQPKIRISLSENPTVATVCKNCVNCTCGVVAVLQIIAKATGIRPRSEW